MSSVDPMNYEVFIDSNNIHLKAEKGKEKRAAKILRYH